MFAHIYQQTLAAQRQSPRLGADATPGARDGTPARLFPRRARALHRVRGRQGAGPPRHCSGLAGGHGQGVGGALPGGGGGCADDRRGVDLQGVSQPLPRPALASLGGRVPPAGPPGDRGVRALDGRSRRLRVSGACPPRQGRSPAATRRRSAPGPAVAAAGGRPSRPPSSHQACRWTTRSGRTSWLRSSCPGISRWKRPTGWARSWRRSPSTSGRPALASADLAADSMAARGASRRGTPPAAPANRCGRPGS